MSDLEALYRAVLASPDEDTPRLMYADCVQERGDEARAKLIRAQCELARTGNPALEPMFPIQTILKANRERWEPACVTCGGDGAPYLGVEGMKTCGACRGTGRQPCRWERGFPVVTVAEMRQVWELGKCPKCSGAGETKFYVPEGPSFDWGKAKPEVTFEVMHKVKYRKCEACSNGAVWQPTQWLRDLLRTHHVAGVVPGGLTPSVTQEADWRAMSVYRSDRVPSPVFRHCCQLYPTSELATAALGRAVVLAALEWLDARGAK